MRTRMWTQIVGAMFFVVITIGEASGLLRPSFGIPMGWLIYALAAAVMVFLAWRTWRKMETETNTKTS